LKSTTWLVSPKSTFCRILLPPELRFGYTDSIDFKSKQDAERSLGRFFLINIDEFGQIKDRLSINKVAYFGRALHKLGINNRRKKRGNEYHVIINKSI